MNFREACSTRVLLGLWLKVSLSQPQSKTILDTLHLTVQGFRAGVILCKDATEGNTFTVYWDRQGGRKNLAWNRQWTSTIGATPEAICYRLGKTDRSGAQLARSSCLAGEALWVAPILPTDRSSDRNRKSGKGRTSKPPQPGVPLIHCNSYREDVSS